MIHFCEKKKNIIDFSISFQKWGGVIFGISNNQIVLCVPIHVCLVIDTELGDATPILTMHTCTHSVIQKNCQKSRDTVSLKLTEKSFWKYFPEYSMNKSRKVSGVKYLEHLRGANVSSHSLLQI